MRAVVLTEYGGVDKMQLRNVADPRPGPGEIVVRMAGASVNPVDWKMRSGAAKDRFPVQFPGILGRDASGLVWEVGPGVTSFHVGDRVFGLVHHGYAELVVGPERDWATIPDGLDLIEAGALPLVLLTGGQLVERAVDPSAGDVVLVTGATGSVGRVAVYAAKTCGAQVWAGVRKSHRADAERLGVDGVVALDDADEIARLPRLDAIADTVGGDVVFRLFDRLRPGGTIGSVLGETPGAKERGFVVHAFTAQPDAEMLARYGQAVAEGALVVPIAEKMPLGRAAAAQALAETRHPGGKVLLLG
jgi:NADPH:quinone reductase-like Zn-dependent oxidoreductase